MDLVERHGGHQRRLDPALVVPIDPAGGGELGTGDRLRGTVMEGDGASGLDLVQTVEGIQRGGVTVVPALSHRALAAPEGDVLSEPERRVLQPAVKLVLQREPPGKPPRAQDRRVRPEHDTFPRGSVVIPAHDEGAVLARTLAPLAPLVRRAGLEIVVACNGCTDNTADVARSVAGVSVLELGKASKTAALNAADTVATAWPRLYLDADVDLSQEAVRDLFTVLAAGSVLAARPRRVYDLQGATSIVRRYYRARSRLPGTNRALWGAGAYALSEEGRSRFGRFPEVTADDLFIDSLFSRDELAIIDTATVTVHGPRDLTGLMAVLRRTYRGNAELRGGDAGRDMRMTTGATVADLVRSMTNPQGALDALTYAALVLAARAMSARSGGVWERDASSRTGTATWTAHREPSNR